MASIDKLVNSKGEITYRIRVSTKDVTGKHVLKTKCYKPKEKSPTKIDKEVQKVAYDFETRVKNGSLYDGDKTLFSQYVHTWQEWIKANVEQRTYESYNDVLKQHVLSQIGNLPIGKIKTQHIQNILNELVQKGRKPQTIKRVKNVINSVMKYAYDMGVIDNNPCERVRVQRETKTDELHIFTIEQTERFLGALNERYAHTVKGHTSKSPKTKEEFEVKDYTQYTEIHFQWRPFFYLAIYGQMRRGELCALTWNDIDWKNRTVSIKRAISKVKGKQIIKEPKTKSGIRTIKVSQICLDLLREWYYMQKEYSMKLGTLWKGKRGKAYDENYIFIQLENGLAMNVDTPTHKFKEIIELYNGTRAREEDKLPNIRLHDLRHTGATLLVSNGLDISTVSHRLGHSNTSVTLNVYTHFMEEKDEKAVELLDSLLKIRA